MIENHAMHCFELSGLGKAPFHFVSFRVAKFQACPGAPIQCGASCDYCGTAIMNVYEIESADGKHFKVGCDCVEKTGDRGLIGQVKAHRNAVARTVRAERAKARSEGRRKLWQETARMRRNACRAQAGQFAKAHGLIDAFKAACRKPGSKSIARKLLQDLRTFGQLSPRAVELVKDLAIVLTPAPSGRVTLTGTVKSVKVKESQRGNVLKMLVLADGGFKVWTTVPAAISSAVAYPVVENLRGNRVSLKVTLQPSDDPGFAFGTRPAGKVIS